MKRDKTDFLILILGWILFIFVTTVLWFVTFCEMYNIYLEVFGG